MVQLGTCTRTGVLVEFSRRGRCPAGKERVPDDGKDVLSWEQPRDQGMWGAGGGQSHNAGWEAGILGGKAAFPPMLLLLPSIADRDRGCRSVKGSLSLHPVLTIDPPQAGEMEERRWIPLTNTPWIQPSGRF